jgi:hypothetical protein
MWSEPCSDLERIVSIWSEQCSDVEWIDVIYVKWFYSQVKWSEVRYGEVLGDKSTM